MTTNLIQPYGGTLVDLLAPASQCEELKEQSRDWTSWDLTPRQICDLELLLCGAFSPLAGFMTRQDYGPVCKDMRLADGTLWPMPITLDVSEALASSLSIGDKLALRDVEGVMLAVLDVEDLWEADRKAEAVAVFGSENEEHPAVDYLLNQAGAWYVGGKLTGLQLPPHYDYQTIRRTPRETRALFAELGLEKIVAFQTRNPMHRAHYELTRRAAQQVGGGLLVHPVVGMTKPGDVDHFTRVRCYEALLPRYPDKLVTLSLLPLAMRMGGPREAVWHAIIRRNYGCTHLVVGRDHAGPGSASDGTPFYGPFDAQELVVSLQEELGVQVVPFKFMVYLPDSDSYAPINEVSEGTKTLSISGTQLRDMLAAGEAIPQWFTFPEVAVELQRTHPPRIKQGFSVFFTGLSGSGKSTVANVLMTRMLEIGGRSVTLLDGDIVRTNLSSELGFSKEHRDLNISRIGFVAEEITKAGGCAICAPIAPYEGVRNENRRKISKEGGYALVHISTPLEVCEQRDRKGLYAKARAGIIKEFTGISDPYEVPVDAELDIDTTNISAEDAAELIVDWLKEQGYLSR